MGVSDPLASTDVATKNYVDTHGGSGGMSSTASLDYIATTNVTA